MDELAVTVSNILNQAAGGVGDISQWLANNGLPGYASVNIAQNTAICLLALAFIVASVAVCLISLKKARTVNDRWGDDEIYEVIAFVSFLVGIASTITFCLGVTRLVGWLASPDGMLLQTLVSGLSK